MGSLSGFTARRIAVALALVILNSRISYAQTDVVAHVKADLQARGVDLSGPCGGFAITARVAWTLRSGGAGLLDKPAGNNCAGRAVDIIVFPDGHAFDVLTDSGGSNGPGWSPIDPVDASRWRAPLDPGDVASPPAPVPVPPPPPMPVPVAAPPPLDLSGVIAAIQALAVQTHSDHQAIIDAVNEPGWVKRIASNRYVQLGLAVGGTYLTNHLATK